MDSFPAHAYQRYAAAEILADPCVDFKYRFDLLAGGTAVPFVEQHERAECVYIQLLHGLDECSDEDE